MIVQTGTQKRKELKANFEQAAHRARGNHTQQLHLYGALLSWLHGKAEPSIKLPPEEEVELYDGEIDIKVKKKPKKISLAEPLPTIKIINEKDLPHINVVLLQEQVPCVAHYHRIRADDFNFQPSDTAIKNGYSTYGVKILDSKLISDDTIVNIKDHNGLSQLALSRLMHMPSPLPLPQQVNPNVSQMHNFIAQEIAINHKEKTISILVQDPSDRYPQLKIFDFKLQEIGSIEIKQEFKPNSILALKKSANNLAVTYKNYEDSKTTSINIANINLETKELVTTRLIDTKFTDPKFFKYGSTSYYYDSNNLAANTKLEAIDKEQGKLRINYHSTIPFEIKQLAYDEKNHFLYALDHQSRLIRFKERPGKVFAYDKDITLTRVNSFSPADHINSFVISAQGDLYLNFEVPNAQEGDTCSYSVFMPYSLIKNSNNLSAIYQTGLSLEKEKSLATHKLLLPKLKKPSTKRIDQLPTNKLQHNNSIKQRIKFSKKSSFYPKKLLPYFYQGLQGGFCMTHNNLNIAHQLGYRFNEEQLYQILDRTFQKRNYSYQNDLIKLIFQGQAEFTVLHILLVGLNSDDQDRQNQTLKYLAESFKTRLDQAELINLAVNANRFYDREEQSNATHAITVLGYEINDKGMDLLCLDTNTGYSKISLEDLAFSLDPFFDHKSVKAIFKTNNQSPSQT